MLVRNPRFRVWSTVAQPEGYPDKIIERYRYTGADGDPRGRARQSRHHHGRPRPDLATRARRLAPDALLEPALPRADPLPPRALDEHEARAVRRRPRPASVQPRGRPRPARPDQRWGRGVPVPAAERERLQLLLPVQRARPREGPPARRRVRHRGAADHDLDPRHPVRAPERRVPGPGPAKHRLQGSDRVLSARRANVLAPRPPGRRRRPLLDPRLPVRQHVFLAFLCSSYTTDPATNQNPAGICDRRLDAQVARARSLETTNPAAATAPGTASTAC